MYISFSYRIPRENELENGETPMETRWGSHKMHQPDYPIEYSGWNAHQHRGLSE